MKATFDLKKEQLEHGKWYKSNEFAVRSIFRFDASKSIEDRFYYYEYFDEGQLTSKPTKKSDFFYTHNLSLFAEVTEEVIEKKFNFKESLDWKEGDYFKVLSDKPNCSGFLLNKIYKAKEIMKHVEGLYGEEINGEEISNSAISINNIRRLNAEETKELENELKRINITSSKGPNTDDYLKEKILDSQGHPMVNGAWYSFIWDYSHDKRRRYAKFDESRSSKEVFISNGTITPEQPNLLKGTSGYDFSLMTDLKRIYKGIEEIQKALPIGHEDVIICDSAQTKPVDLEKIKKTNESSLLEKKVIDKNTRWKVAVNSSSANHPELHKWRQICFTDAPNDLSWWGPGHLRYDGIYCYEGELMNSDLVSITEREFIDNIYRPYLREKMLVNNNDNQQIVVVKNEDNIHKNITVSKTSYKKEIVVEEIVNIKI